MPRRSRLAKTEQKKAVKTATVYLVLTILLLIFVMGFALRFLNQIANFVFSFTTNGPIQISDQTPPPPPQLDPFSNFSSKTTERLTGKSEPGSTVKLHQNGSTTKEVVAAANGEFSFSLKLLKGPNTFYLEAADKEGNTSALTQTFSLTQDSEPPEINIDTPADQENLYGKDQKQISIQGSTELGSALTINDRVVVISSDGHFSHPVTLNDGENTFQLKAVDQAQNETQQTLTVFYNP